MIIASRWHGRRQGAGRELEVMIQSGANQPKTDAGQKVRGVQDGLRRLHRTEHQARQQPHHGDQCRSSAQHDGPASQLRHQPDQGVGHAGAASHVEGERGLRELARRDHLDQGPHHDGRDQHLDRRERALPPAGWVGVTAHAHAKAGAEDLQMSTPRGFVCGQRSAHVLIVL